MGAGFPSYCRDCGGLYGVCDCERKATIKSVLQDWVMKLPLRHQGVLVLALRGPDSSPKESPSKPVIRSLRACVMNSGREGTAMEIGQVFTTDSFMRMDLISSTELWNETIEKFYSSIDEYNIHFLQHLLHAAALCHQHPNHFIATKWWKFYLEGVRKLHMNPEDQSEICHRLRDGIREDQDE